MHSPPSSSPKRQGDSSWRLKVQGMPLGRRGVTVWFIMSALLGTTHGLSRCRSVAKSPPRFLKLFSAQIHSISSKIEGLCREDFPLIQNVDAYPGKKLVYLDSAASSQKPKLVLDTMDQYYRTSHANVHRGTYSIATKATEMFENARISVQNFINASAREEIIFTRGATDAINLVALSYGQYLKAGDEIILSLMEHHSNLVPWQMLSKRTGAILKFVQLTEDMTLDMDHYRSLLSPKTKLVAVTHVSNVLGTINPIEEIVCLAKNRGAVVLVDACQSVPHMPIDVQALNVDFLVASSHKMCGPTGIGFLYGKKALLENMSPVFGGGEMIETVTLDHSTYTSLPYRFEAGTPPIAEAIGLGAACDYLKKIGMQRIFEHEQALGTYLYEQLSSIDQLTLYGPSIKSSFPNTITRTAGLIAFNAKKVHATDVSFFLDQEGIAVRTGHHCAQPLHEHLGAPGSIRASLYLYNSQEDVDFFIAKLKETLAMFENL